MTYDEALRSASHTRSLQIGNGVLGALAPLVRAELGASIAVLVADETTMTAAGNRVERELVAGGVEVARRLVLPAAPAVDARYENAELVREFLAKGDGAPIAVGSGTINDLVKRAAFELKRPYATVATAASVDGYTSYGAALVLNGFKVSMECDAPRVVVADLDVLARAPAKMTAAGYGDLIAKIPGGADWIIADVLGIDPIVPLGWSMVQDDLRQWVADPAAIGRREPAAVARLFGGLAVTGFAMQALKSSRPVSGAEHLLSHVWEMQHLEFGGEPVSHGFKVGIGTLGTTALMEVLAARDIESVDPSRRASEWPVWAAREASIREAWGGNRAVESALEQSAAKFIAPAALDERLRLAKRRWPAIRDRIRRQLIPYGELRTMFEAAGAPTTPEAIGLTRERALSTFRLAQTIRDRYTVLDFAVELGLLDSCLDELNRSNRYWR